MKVFSAGVHYNQFLVMRRAYTHVWCGCGLYHRNILAPPYILSLALVLHISATFEIPPLSTPCSQVPASLRLVGQVDGPILVLNGEGEKSSGPVNNVVFLEQTAPSYAPEVRTEAHSTPMTSAFSYRVL